MGVHWVSMNVTQVVTSEIEIFVYIK